MPNIIVRVSVSITRVQGLDPLRLNDLYMDAPEMPPSGFGGLRTNAANLLYLFQELPDATWIDPENRLLEARAQRFVEGLRRVQPGEYEANFPFKTAPYAFQMQVFAPGRLMKNIALAPAAPGVGKTKIMLDIGADKFMREEIDCIAIIAPAGVHRQWIKKGVPVHLSDSVPRFAEVWRSTKKHYPEVVELRTGTRRRLRIIAFNVEAFSTESGKAARFLRGLMQRLKTMLILDESTRVKNYRAIRTKTIIKLREFSAARAILTGTPMTKGIEDLYCQYEFLDPDIIGMSNYFAFRNRHCVVQPAFRGAALGAVRIVGYRNVEELVRKIAPHSFYIPKDVLGLPEKTWVRWPVTMTEEQRTIYNAMKQELIEDLIERRIESPANAAVRIMRLQQVLSGYVTEPQAEPEDEDAPLPPRIQRRISSNRISVLLERLASYDGQAVIWCTFTQDIIDVHAALTAAGKRAGMYYGGIKPHERDEYVRQFKEGDLDYLVGNPVAGGTGVDDLQVASLAVYFSHTTRQEARLQSLDRIHRIGMRGTALYADMEVEGTVDSLRLRVYETRENLARAVYENPRILEAFPDQEEITGHG